MNRPESEAALAEMIKSAVGPIAVQGGGTRGMSSAGEPVSASELTGISLYEPGALTLVAQAGTPVADIEMALAAEGQRLAFEPMDHRALLGTSGSPTIGGVVAGNVSGPRRIQGGAARDYALGVRFVDGAGNIVKNGGRVMKNVTGYDLVKVMCGSFGTLGVLTEVSLKVLPVPEMQATLRLGGLSDSSAVAVMSAAMSSPFEVTGAAHIPASSGNEVATFLRVEGFENSVKYRIEALRGMLKEAGTETSVLDDAASNNVWQSIRDVKAMADVPGDVWRISCKPSEAAALAARSSAYSWFFDWAGGLIWVCMSEGADLRTALGEFDGHATLVRANAETRAAIPVFQPEAAGLARLSAGLRARFDPRGILNTGLMGPAHLEDA